MAQPVWQDLCSSADFSIRTQIFICSLWQTNNFLPCFRPLCTPSSSVAWLRLTVFSKKTTLSTITMAQPVWQDLCSSADFSIRTQIFICSLWQTNNFLPCFRPLCTPSSSVAWLRLTVFSKKTTLSTSFRQQPDDRSEETKIENLVRQS